MWALAWISGQNRMKIVKTFGADSIWVLYSMSLVETAAAKSWKNFYMEKKQVECRVSFLSLLNINTRSISCGADFSIRFICFCCSTLLHTDFYSFRSNCNNVHKVVIETCTQYSKKILFLVFPVRRSLFDNFIQFNSSKTTNKKWNRHSRFFNSRFNQWQNCARKIELKHFLIQWLSIEMSLMIFFSLFTEDLSRVRVFFWVELCEIDSHLIILWPFHRHFSSLFLSIELLFDEL